MADVHVLPQPVGTVAGRTGLTEISISGGGFIFQSHKGVGVIGFVVLFGLWEVSVRAGWVNRCFCRQ